ncbi:MAG: kelch repeat-containing protein [Patescibacteria group bacterium]
MKKFVLIILIVLGLVYSYFWYVRGIDLLLSGDETVYLPPYTKFAVRLPVPSADQMDSSNPVWSSALSMPTPRSDAAAASIGNIIYVVGGTDSFARTVATVEAFDMSANTWLTVADLPKALHHVALVVHDNKLYSLGGLEGLSMTPSSDVYLFDPKVGTWEKINPMLSAVGAAAAVVHQGKIHVLGGQAATGITDLHMVYDPSDRQWSWGTALLAPRGYHGAASLGNQLVIFGGRSGSLAYNLRTTDILLDGSEDWERWEPMSIKRSGFGTAQLGGTVYAFGGEAPTLVMDTVEMLDPELHAWKLMPAMPTARQGAAVATAGGRIFVIGGGKHVGVSVSDINEVFIPSGYVKSEDEQ